MTTVVMGVDLDLADDGKYSDYIVRQAFRNGALWTLMLEPERIDRTLELMKRLKGSLETQLSQAKLYQGGGEKDWRKRTSNLLNQTDIYLADVKAEVKRLDREEYEESAMGQRDEWRRIAGLLVDLLRDNPALGFIQLPGEGNITAAAWARLRVEKADALRLEQGLEVAA